MLLINRWGGPLLVGLAAFLWATDAVVRYPAISSIDPTFLVFVEHVLAVIILLPWVLLKHREEVFAFSFREWFAAIFSGMGGSALATVIFTASFYYVNPSVAVLLQKLQPVMVVIIAYLFLGERPEQKFFIWGTIALAAGIILSFPDLNFGFLSGGLNIQSKGIQYAFGAAFLWAASTVSGKIVLIRTPPVLATFWRFFFGFVLLAVLMVLAKTPVHWEQFSSGSSLAALLYLSLIPGLFAMLIYYQGLARTRANVTTFIELLYPIGAVALNTVFLHTSLDAIQTAAAAVLLVAVGMISR
jgi:drug/metabolite transporter (DMT)-like permease